MANLFDYIDWRGDLPFSVSPLNEVDCLIFSWLVYAPVDGLVPGEFGKSVTIRELSRSFLATHDLKKILKNSACFTRTSALALKRCGESARYGDLKVSAFINGVDYGSEMQFAAMTVDLGGTFIVAFRGTDDTLIGWKEDFNMCFTGEIPAQAKAKEYLEAAARAVRGHIVTCGHSKGGNLAVYSACKVSKRTRNRIVSVFNFDGPGFGELTDLGEGKNEIFQKTRTFVPEQSIVGMLLDHDENYTVVSSDGQFIFQHDAGTWQVIGPHFVTLESIDPYSEALDITIRNWIKELGDEERETFVNALFGVMLATSSRTLEEINSDILSFASETIKNYNGLPKETKAMLKKIVSLFIKQGTETIKRRKKQLPSENRLKLTQQPQ